MTHVEKTAIRSSCGLGLTCGSDAALAVETRASGRSLLSCGLLVLLETIFRDVTDAIVVADPDRTVLIVNPAFTRMFGYQPADIVGQKVGGLYESEDECERRWRTPATRDSNAVAACAVVQYRRRDGSVFPGETVAAAVSDANGYPVAYLGIIRDVGDRVSLEHALRSLHHITSTRDLAFVDKVGAILRLGIEHFGLPNAVVGRAEGDSYRVLYAASADAAVAPGESTALGSAFCAHTLGTDGPVAFERAGADRVGDHPCCRASKLESYIGAPLLVDGTRFGTLSYFSAEPRSRAFCDGDLEMVRLFAEWIGNEIARQNDLEQLREIQERLRLQATTDDLTGIPNRRFFMERADREFDRALRYGRPLAVLVIDADRFKSVNDAHGHDAGDRVLCAIATVLERSVRSSDMVARIGGEEFATVLAEADADTAAYVAERLRGEVAAVGVAHETGTLGVTVSIGVAGLRADDTGFAAILKRADRALYAAKQAGRNTVRAL